MYAFSHLLTLGLILGQLGTFYVPLIYLFMTFLPFLLQYGGCLYSFFGSWNLGWLGDCIVVLVTIGPPATREEYYSIIYDVVSFLLSVKTDVITCCVYG